MKGFVVVQPGAPKDFLHFTFGKTATEAWRRFLGERDKLDYPILRQRFVDRGYRVAKATLVIE